MLVLTRDLRVEGEQAILATPEQRVVAQVAVQRKDQVPAWQENEDRTGDAQLLDVLQQSLKNTHRNLYFEENGPFGDGKVYINI